MESPDTLVETLQKWIEIFMRRSMHVSILYVKSKGLSMPQVGALMRIHKSACGVSEIGAHLGISNAAASQLLDRLVLQGYVHRSEHPQDRRAKKLVLTEKGVQIVRESLQAREEWLQTVVETLTPQEKKQVIDTLKILIEKASRLESPNQQS